MTAPTDDELNAPTSEAAKQADNATAERITAFRNQLIAHRKAQDISHPELAKIMDMGRARVIGAETCDPKQWRVHTMIRYAEAIGLELVLEFRPKQ